MEDEPALEPGPALEGLRDLAMFLLDVLIAEKVISASELATRLQRCERQALVDQLRGQAEVFGYAARYCQRRAKPPGS